MLFFIMTVSVIQRFQSKTKTETQSNILLFVIGSVVICSFSTCTAI